ncbi:ATP-dependent DNA helicase [Bacillus sp. WLY-B-L8]|uniref:ATP-dependent DNA helicase n=1 Tax=Bacillus multifaciens TaxID=3068506 RepID=UPI002741F9AD|nr:ATP-dependent DNA helicase [Bacillus sp. WLY-B-L8]MDP7979707.1 ATP-dependent DNA helicase [Bacillus sp. WLY-B-L8]
MDPRADSIFQIFEEEIPKHYDTNVIRTSQVQMALDIGDFLESNKKIMIIEAPVGTGKSLGALVPLLVDKNHSKFNQRAIMYATATINLQGQLMESEVPLLNKLGLVKSPILAKGKSHYYCHFNLKKVMTDTEKTFFSRAEQDVFTNFFQTSNSGQRSDLERDFRVNIEDSKWRKLELSNNSYCRGCQYSLSCPTLQHRRRFKASENDLVITNHDQLINSFLSAMDMDSIYEPVLKTDMGVVVIDEAHDFLETFIGQLEQSFSLSKLKNVEKYIKKDKYKWGKAISHLKNWLKQVKDDNERFDTGRYKLSNHVFATLKVLQGVVNGNLFDAKDKRSDILEDLSIVLHNFLQKHEYTSWVTLEDNTFHIVKNNYKETFREMLDYIKIRNKIIFMSGTLTVNGDFSYIKNQWRIEPGEDTTKVLESPFDYRNQALVYIPKGLGNPNHDAFLEKALKETNRLLKLTQGRTLLLNTSKEHMDGIHNGIKNKLATAAIPLYKQGESGVEKLTKQFKDIEESVLVGSGSFFSGFSIAGTALTSVILNKLPFPPSDPIVELLSQGAKNRFDEVNYPMMINKLEQAVGRLIRSIKDYGIITILDQRIYTSDRYGKDVQNLLESHGYILTRSWDSVVSFYKNKLHKGAEAEYKPYNRSLIKIGNILGRPKKKNKTKTHINSSKKITQKQKLFLEKACKDAGFMVDLKGDTIILFKRVCLSLFLTKLPFTKIMRDFPYKDLDERTILEGYLAHLKSKKTVEEIHQYMLSDILIEKKLSPNKVTKEQRAFLKELIARENLRTSIKRNVNDAYKVVYDELYSTWKDVSYLQEQFPYRDEEEKMDLSTYHGGNRRKAYPICTKLGCNGDCTEEQHMKITNYLINTYRATGVSYMKVNRGCLVRIEPTKILEQDEFCPDELLQQS